MYLFLSTSAILAAFAWYLENPTFFMISIVVSILSSAYLYILSTQKDTFVQQCIHCMERTECCCVHKLWSNPNSVVWTQTTLRTIAGVTAAVATQNTWQYYKAFVDGSYWTVSTLWVLAISIWFISCVPILICLIQCAAKQGKKTPLSVKIANNIIETGQKIHIDEKTIKLVDSKTIIVRFRKVMTIQLIHDIVIGIFWLYLSISLYDLIDDGDDSEWRTIFLSMLSWHIVFVTIYHIYLKSIRSTLSITRGMKSRPCCAPSEANKWWSLTQLLGLAAIYISFIWRMREPTLTNMGCSLETLILFTFGVLAWAFGKKMTTHDFQGTLITTKITSKNKKTMLEF